MRPATGSEIGEGGDDRRCEPGDLGRVEGTRRSSGIEAGSPESLVSEEVAEAGEPTLIEQEGFEAAAPSGAEECELARVDGGDVRPDPFLLGVEADPGETAGVEERHPTAGSEPHLETEPAVVQMPGPVEEWSEDVDPVDQEPAGKAEVEAERDGPCRVRLAARGRAARGRAARGRAAAGASVGALVDGADGAGLVRGRRFVEWRRDRRRQDCTPSPLREVEEEELASPSDRAEIPADHRPAEIVLPKGASDSGVDERERDDRLADQSGQGLAASFGLERFGHARVCTPPVAFGLTTG